MIKISDITFEIDQIAGSDIVLLTDIREAFAYEDGKRTDKSDGFRCTVVAPDKKFAEFSIKTPKAVVTPEQLASAKGGMIKVRVKNFEGRFYRTREGDYAFTSIADSMEVVTA